MKYFKFCSSELVIYFVVVVVYILSALWNDFSSHCLIRIKDQDFKA